MGRKKSNDKQRIEWLEQLVEKSAKYIDLLEKKLHECEKDRKVLVDWYWKAQKLAEEKDTLKREVESLKVSNRALLGALSEIEEEYKKIKRSPTGIACDEKIFVNASSDEIEAIERAKEDNDCKEENKEVAEFKSELRKVITEKLKQRNKIDIKA